MRDCQGAINYVRRTVVWVNANDGKIADLITYMYRGDIAELCPADIGVRAEEF